MLQKFDHFIIVDWSARNAPSPSKPTKDSIWVANGSSEMTTTSGRSKPIYCRYYRTRKQAFDAICRKLVSLRRDDKRVLLGCDFSFGYPKGLSKALKLKGDPWVQIWREWHRLIEDDAHNRNNRFQVASELNRRIGLNLGPFWGAPRGESGIFLGPTKDFSYPVFVRGKIKLEEKRIVEQKNKKLQASWKLAYIGSVGSQSLLGIPYLYDMRFKHKQLADQTRVWPFETGLCYPEDVGVVMAEIWPSLIERPKKDSIPDREQVRTFVRWLRIAQANGTIESLFSGPEKGLLPKEVKRVEKHEGWILGIH